MFRTVNLRTTQEHAYIDGHPLFDDMNDMLVQMLGWDATRKVSISQAPFEGCKKATETGRIGKNTIFNSKDGNFTICNKSVTDYKLGKQFYYKINKAYDTTKNQ